MSAGLQDRDAAWHRLHRWSALVIGSYAFVHLLNHLTALWGIERHLAFMRGYRHVYRVPALEFLLLACIAYQVCSGTYFIARRWRERRGFFERAQAISGGYLAFFVLFHIGAVMYGRLVLGLDINFFFAAAGLNIAPFQWFFLPYYALGVTAFVTHVVCALHYLTRRRFRSRARNVAGYVGVAAGALLAAVIVATFSGAFYRVVIPPAYQATFH